MDIRQAILKAADHIAGNPNRFDFMSCSIPNDGNCGTPGCALGWINFFMGFREDCSHRFLIDRLALDCNSEGFYTRMAGLTDSKITERCWGEWTQDAARCALGLRLYADKYHPADEGTKEYVRPDWNALAMQPLPVGETAQV